MEKIKSKALKLKKYYEKKQRRDQEEIEKKVERLQLRFELLKNHRSGAAEGWEKESSIYSHSDLYIESNTLEEEEAKKTLADLDNNRYSTAYNQMGQLPLD